MPAAGDGLFHRSHVFAQISTTEPASGLGQLEGKAAEIVSAVRTPHPEQVQLGRVLKPGDGRQPGRPMLPQWPVTDIFEKSGKFGGFWKPAEVVDRLVQAGHKQRADGDESQPRVGIPVGNHIKQPPAGFECTMDIG